MANALRIQAWVFNLISIVSLLVAWATGSEFAGGMGFGFAMAAFIVFNTLVFGKETS